MIKKTHIIIYLLISLFYGCSTMYYNNIEAFTHPLDSNPVSLYLKPGKYYKELYPDTEAGWIVEITQKKGGYFKININDLSLNDVFIRTGELGLILRNVDSRKIPVYEHPDTLSSIKDYLSGAGIGKLYDISNGFALLKFTIDGKITKGWIEFYHLCNNPYTTCN